jgi:hypothetical protein
MIGIKGSKRLLEILKSQRALAYSLQRVTTQRTFQNVCLLEILLRYVAVPLFDKTDVLEHFADFFAREHAISPMIVHIPYVVDLFLGEFVVQFGEGGKCGARAILVPILRYVPH